MKFYLKSLVLACVLALPIGLSACSEKNDPRSEALSQDPQTLQAETVKLDVYKSPNCGCCGDWIDHIEAAGFETLVHHPENLSLVKEANGIRQNMQSCHTAISNHGYVFEGHIPADVMQRFLENPPAEALGLAVPGMPIGSPGMEMGDRYDDYAVLLIKKDGRTEVFERISGRGHHE
jgi:hypothetical protein